MRREENWAIDTDRIRAFFRAQADVREDGGRFIFGGCIITLIPLSGNAMGKWVLPRTQIVFEGNDMDVKSIHHRFFLRFLSAGG